MNNFNFDLDNNVDEDFFGSLKGNKSSKLQQLFGEETLSSDDKQQSLKYQRPKANDLKSKEFKAENATTTNANSITLLAKVVTAYKQGELQGKVGLALIQNPDNSCNIIMYKTKVNILATLQLSTQQDLLYKQNKYWQFYAEDSVYWSFSFDTLKDEDEFVYNIQTKGINFKETQEDNKQLQEETNTTEAQSINVEHDFNSFIPADATKESKNSLIKRMAKMGRPLPTLSSTNQHTTTEYSDSSDTEVIKTPLTSTQKPGIPARSSKLTSIKSQQQMVTAIAAYNAAQATTSAVYPVNPLESQYMQMLLTEQRTQGSELRMNMNKLENKIEKVLDKLELCDRMDSKQKPERDDEILELEEKLLMLKKENRKLKQNLQEQSLKDKEEEKIQDIIEEFKEDFNYLKIEYKQDLKTIIKELTKKLKEEFKLKEETREQLVNNDIQIKELQKDLMTKSSHNKDLENEVRLLKEQAKDLELKLNKKESEVLKQNEELLKLQKQLEDKKLDLAKTPDNALVKSIMNNLYVDIAEKLDRSNLPQSEQILSLIAASIRQQTLKSLQQIKLQE
ncbi:epidermal growth factor receptor substrate 15 homolog [Lucilia cuprina]|uniref:epidermal growth factor receptor substrate 15 homolog n=1 Tax=Lucilia cuprina TaxID=7375 RepID=UPI001F05FD97|nr:epidermal growth factor receptor substrate 15 homolog [Lucilia cuprina]